MDRFTKYVIVCFIMGFSSWIIPLLLQWIQFPLLPLDIVIRVLWWILPLGFVVTIVKIVLWTRQDIVVVENGKKGLDLTNFPYKYWMFWWATGSVLFILSGLIESSGRLKVKNILDSFNENAEVYINDKRSPKALDIISALSKLDSLPAHHSHDMEHFQVRIKDRDRELVLELGQDSKRSDEYWVYYPKYKSTKYNEIGKISTNIFKDY